MTPQLPVDAFAVRVLPPVMEHDPVVLKLTAPAPLPPVMLKLVVALKPRLVVPAVTTMTAWLALVKFTVMPALLATK